MQLAWQLGLPTVLLLPARILFLDVPLLIAALVRVNVRETTRPQVPRW
jgi:hypothetical protein